MAGILLSVASLVSPSLFETRVTRHTGDLQDYVGQASVAFDTTGEPQAKNSSISTEHRIGDSTT